MVDFDEVQGYGRKFENQLAKLREASISDADRAAIIAFIQHEEAQGKVNTGTMVNHINRLRLAAERSDISLTEMQDKTAVDGLLFSLKHDHGLAEGTLRNYRKALRKFFRYRDRDWADDIKIGVSPERTVDPNDLLTDEEIEDLLEAASHPRDKALVSLIADTGLRIGAIASLRIHDVDLTNRAGTVSINEEANVKGATGTVPLTWSRGYVANWLDVHPRSDEEEAALFHKVRFVEDGEDGAMSYQYLGRRIKWIADEAGIDRDRVNTHNFRKTAISRWIREGLNEQAIKHRATWVKDSSQFEVYSGVRDEELNESILAHYDLVDEDEESSRPNLEACPQCRTPLRQHSRFCPGCGAPLTQGAAETVTDAEDDLFGDVSSGLNPGSRATIRELHTALQDDPGLRDLLLD
ncbi:phage integrase [Haladaptatus paucihalophilus DX253]|uniref:Phage integrase n=1 Tax=Haladaptatus paucihalophilus DX253 TaxID=797209 RepID=E7QYA8_HALPU|nr:site-specific integrase [Haladaptatus paucihalophilus]EFW90433.1 phage integrase [Haladaptatus paucihalophilus DX253]SHL68830.1 Site-specific recombinase XerD [Haladaptatus paucihalophilus DX253]